MPLTAIRDRALNTTITIARKTTTRDANTGEAVNTSANVYTGVPATIQENESIVQPMEQGIHEIETNTCYLNNIHNGAALTVLRNDTVLDAETNQSYRVVSILHLKAARKSVNTGHHLQLGLERIV